MYGNGRIYPKRLVTPGFNPESLVAGGGYIYDFSDNSKLFQEPNGTVPVESPGDLVGRVVSSVGDGYMVGPAPANNNVIWNGQGLMSLAAGAPKSFLPMPLAQQLGEVFTIVSIIKEGINSNSGWYPIYKSVSPRLTGYYANSVRNYAARYDSDILIGPTQNQRNDDTVISLAITAEYGAVNFYYNGQSVGAPAIIASPDVNSYGIRFNNPFSTMFYQLQSTRILTVDEIINLTGWGIKKYA